MGKDQVNWEPDIRKGMDIAKDIKDLNQDLKDDADRRKIDGYNPGDLGGPTSSK